MQKYSFKTKAETLFDLSSLVKLSNILPLKTINYHDFKIDTNFYIKEIQDFFEEDLLIVRSSCSNEDTNEQSSAGMFESILNVDKLNSEMLIKAIEAVFASYNTKEEQVVLIQPMLSGIAKSGVGFTCDIDTIAPYYVINFDETDKSDTITNGSSRDSKTFICFKNSTIKIQDPNMNSLINCIKEIELILGHKYLDIEFGIDIHDNIYIFQVRPIVVSRKENFSNLPLDVSLNKIFKKVEKLMSKHPNLLGDRTVFGVMPDWNPAEIIGLRPKQLSISLYKELIMDNIWAYQRDNYGYRNLRSHPLMVTFLGVPFIDVRVTFNSFIPKNLNEITSEKLANYYIEKLISKPIYHDKVEFEIVYSCYFANLNERLLELLDYGFDNSELIEIESCLLELTNNIIDPVEGLYKKDIEKCKLLEKKYDDITNSNLSIVDKIYWLVEDCKRYGTLPFAGVARAGFIAVQFLKSFVDSGIITDLEYNTFMNSLNTISKEMNEDLLALSQGSLSKEVFLDRYGHIRPGSYDIMSYCYDEKFDSYFSKDHIFERPSSEFTFTIEQEKKINDLLIKGGVKVNAKDLTTFIIEAIEGREYTKFVFSKSLSMCLKLVEEFGGKYGISREDLAFVDIHRILELYASLDHRDVYDILMDDIVKNKRMYHYTKAVKFPSLIISPEDIYQFYLLDEEPNFITQKSVTALKVDEKDIQVGNIEGLIVMIESADPGYDFLFSRNIGGLITKFGGANSHMAIRCAELGIPAVIGSGEKNYIEWKKANRIEVNCLNKQVKCFN